MNWEDKQDMQWLLEDLLIDIQSEQDMQDWWVKFLTYTGWEVHTEVTPDRSNYRADLLMKHDGSPWIGMELKYGLNGKKVARGIDQVRHKYRNQVFIDEHPVRLWAMCFFSPADANTPVFRPVNNEHPFLRELLCAFGLGICGMSLNPSIDFNFSDKACKVDLGDARGYPPMFDDTDFTKIRKQTSDKAVDVAQVNKLMQSI